MPHVRLSRVLALFSCAAILALAPGANGALVRVNDIVLHADGGFQPRLLPKRRFAPIDFRGFFDIAAKSGGRPVALEEAVIDFDRDGKLDARGLPVCSPEEIENTTPVEARRLCAGSIVGEGRVEAVVEREGTPSPVGSPLTLFNGPPQDGEPTVILHARAGGIRRSQWWCRSKAQRGIPLPRHPDLPADRRRARIDQSRRSRGRPPFPRRRSEAQLCFGPLLGRDPAHPRPLSLRRRDDRRRQRRKGLYRLLYLPARAASSTG